MITSAFAPASPAKTTSTTERSTMVSVRPFSWNWREPGDSQAFSCRIASSLPRSLPKNRACWAANTSASILPFQLHRSPLTSTIDALAPIGIPQEVTVDGAQRTTFFPTVLATAHNFDLAVVPDAHPEAGGYYRSDHFSPLPRRYPRLPPSTPELSGKATTAPGEKPRPRITTTTATTTSPTTIPPA